MEIIENTDYLTNQKRYEIRIKQDDDLEAWEIAECFKEQYPKKIAIISFARIIKMSFGIILVGVNLGGLNTKPKSA